MSALASLRARLTHSGPVLADQLLVSGTSFVTTVALVRALGLDGFGRFSLLWMGVVFVQALQQACIGTPLYTIGPKELQRGTQAAAHYDAGVQRLELAFLAGVLAVGACGARAIAQLLGFELGARELAALVLAALARAAHDFARQRAFAREEPRRALALDGVACGVQLATLAALTWFGRIDPAVSTTLPRRRQRVRSARRALVAPRRAARRTSRRTLERHLGMSRWLIALALLQWLTSNAFALAAGALLGPAAVGALKAGQTILGVLHVLLLAFENVVPVRAAALAARGARRELASYLRRISWTGGFAVLAVSACVAAFPGRLARVIYGATSADQELAIRAFALHYVFVFLIGVLSVELRTLERTRPIFVAQALGALAALFAAHSTVEAFGLRGALAGMILQQFLVLLVLWFATRRERVEALDDQAASAAFESATP